MAISFPNAGRKAVLALTALLAAGGPLTAQPTAKRDEEIHFINATLATGWREHRLKPSAKVTDHQFLRRASLDVIGRIPTVEEIRTFEQDRRPDRRARLIDRLLDSPEYSRHWAGTWTDWLLGGAVPDPERDRQLQGWLEQQFARNVSYKALAEKLLTATGKASDNPAVLYVLAHLGTPFPAREWSEKGQFDAVPITWRSTHLFLGIRLNCVRCHDHPHDDEWRQSHFWGVNAFFRQVERRGVQGPGKAAPAVELLDNPRFNAEPVVAYERRNGVVCYTKPIFFTGEKMPRGAQNRREQLAKFVTGNDYFAKAFVNRLWTQFFGRGLNTSPEPDDFGEHNPAVQPELLDGLARAFVASGHDPKALIRWLCNSDAYQLDSVANATNGRAEAEPFFSRMPLKATSPRQRVESLLVAFRADATLSAAERDRLRQKWRSACELPEFAEERDGYLCVYRERVVREAAFEALWLMAHNREIAAALAHEKGTVAEALKAREPAERLAALYLAAYNRPPTARETERLLKAAGAGGGSAVWWQDLYFAMLNSSEFVLNH